MPRADKHIYFLIGLFTLFRLIVAPFFGLGCDEAHYVLFAKYLDWSYFDHPPLVGWVHALFLNWLGTNEWIARLPAIIIFAVTSFCAYVFTLRISGSIRVSLWAVLALNSSFMLNALGVMLLPDSLLLPLIFTLIFIAEKMEHEKKTSSFLLLGIVLGLMGLAKYTSILLVPPLILYFLIKKRFDILFSFRMVLAALIAILLVTPVIYWNSNHDFASFRYQGSHIFGNFHPNISYFLESIALQFGVYSPFLFIIAFYGFFKSIRVRNDYLLLPVLFGGTIMVFFLFTSFSERLLPHWTGLFYLLFIPLGTYEIIKAKARWKKVFLHIAIAFNLIVLLLAYAELAGKFFTFPDYQSPFRDIYGYPEICQQADTLVRKDKSEKAKALAVTHWTMASRIMVYSIPYRHELFVIDKRRDQFDEWQKKDPIGYDLLFLVNHLENVDISSYALCRQVELAGVQDLRLNGAKVDTVKFVWCRDYQGLKP
ncbi:MAG: glycosyltransferase family 39 protein [Deltaproteobacteria bacterium]|nr:glycosyltransferase family 39 protein [Deltaproteobacteria bacterium]